MKNKEPISAVMQEIETTHILQRAFRKTFRAFSFPGVIEDLSSESVLPDFGLSIPDAMLLLARMLLDAETSFACPDDDVARAIEMLTFSHRLPISEADFIFVDGSGSALIDSIEKAKIGSLVDPHEGATLVVSVSFRKGNPWILSGPGIEDVRCCDVSLASGWDSIRAKRNAEFPLGIDMILVSAENKMIALPRTTLLKRGGC